MGPTASKQGSFEAGGGGVADAVEGFEVLGGGLVLSGAPSSRGWLELASLAVELKGIEDMSEPHALNKPANGSKKRITLMDGFAPALMHDL